jgi:hypothetical protein
MMRTKVLLEMSISLDDYIAGPDVDSESPMGRGDRSEAANSTTGGASALRGGLAKAGIPQRRGSAEPRPRLTRQPPRKGEAPTTLPRRG